jgi:hypothetical protein
MPDGEPDGHRIAIGAGTLRATPALARIHIQGKIRHVF